MKKRNYTLSIPTPCSEDVDSMESTEQGKFCTSCAKHVVDFTNLSDTEIISYLQNQEGKLCGRLRQSQMNRVLQDVRPSSRIRRWQKVLVSMLLLAPFTQTLAQDTPKKARKQRTYIAPVEEIETPIKPEEGSDLSKRVIRGIVVDDTTGQGLRNCVINLLHHPTNIYTNENGEFSFFIPDSIQKDVYVLCVTHISYIGKVLRIAPDSISMYKRITLREAEGMTYGDIDFIRHTPIPNLQHRSLWRRVSRLWRK